MVEQRIEGTKRGQVEASREITDPLREFWTATEQAHGAEAGRPRGSEV